MGGSVKSVKSVRDKISSYIAAKNNQIMQLIGREQEQKELRRLYESGQPEFVAVYGRRRVGKTFLVKEFFHNHFTFYSSGLARGSKQNQLEHFGESLSEYGLKVKQAPSSWKEAFKLLRQLIDQSSEKRKVIFLDEVPWLDTQKSDFVQAIDLFWNEWASSRDDILLIVCGSAASWMVKNIIRNTGGLHNRLTCKLHISPFTLGECKSYLESKSIRWNDQSIAECYMILGGIPYYLQQLDKSLSLTQNIDRLFFNENALLKDEYDNLYTSLFKHSEEFIRIVECLFDKRCGLTRDELTAKTGLSNGGGLTRKLDELEQCGFIRKYKPIGVDRNIYQLVDFYTIFYLYFIRKQRVRDEQSWMHLQGSHTYSTWVGLSFERLCFAHAPQIRHALGISGVATKTFALYTHEAQIDMLIERADRTISVCEMKWTENVNYVITKAEATKLQNRLALARGYYPNKNCLLCMITSSELKQNEYSIQWVQQTMTLNQLFLAI